MNIPGEGNFYGSDFCIASSAVYAAAVHFFLADGDLQQREWIFCSSVMGQEA